MPAPQSLAVLFPGQGSQAPGMREAVERHRPDLLELAEAAVGDDPFTRLGDGTRFDQPAIYCASLACFEALGRPRADFYAGHSLGELTALTMAGAVSERDGLELVAERGRLMQQAAAERPGGMLALRCGRGRAEELAARWGLELANDNGPDQVVLSGPEPALERAEREARPLGVRAKRLPVAGAFHSGAMAGAAERFRDTLRAVELGRPAVPVMSCLTAAPLRDVRAALAEALTRPVRWLELLGALDAAGVRRFLEPGPGRVLSGLVRRSLPEAEIVEPAHA